MTKKTRSTNNLPYCQTRRRISEATGLANSGDSPSRPSFVSKRVWTTLCSLFLIVNLVLLQPSLCQCSISATPNAQSLQRHNHHHHNHHQHHHQQQQQQQQRQHGGEQGHADVDNIEGLSDAPQIEKPLNSNADSQDKMQLCPNCFLSEKNSRNDKTSNDALRLEAIKYQILSKLGLKSKPNVTSPVPREVILETLYRAEGTSNVAGLGLLERERERERESESEEEETIAGTYGGNHGGTSSRPVTEGEQDDYFGRTSEIIAFAEPGHTLNGQPLLEFAHSHDDAGGTGSELRVKGASLWVHVHFRTTLPKHMHNRLAPRNLTLWVFRILHSNTTQLSGKEFDEHTEMAASLPVTLSNLGWQKFDLTATVRDWYSKSGSYPRQRLRLLVDCSGCGDLVEAVLFRDPGGGGGGRSEELLLKDPQRPFLVIHTDPSQTKRVRRRALDCSGALKGQCCKQRFYVSFKQLGWEDWIIAPGGYYANYCRGDCGGIHRTPDTFLNYYTHVMEEFRKMDRLSGMQSCCAPLKFSSMSLIYFGPDSNIIKRDLPKMVVDECGCP